MRPTYVIEPLPKANSRGDKWTAYAHHANGDMVFIGHHKTRRAAIVSTRLLAGWRGKVEVRDSREYVTAFRVPA